MTYTTAIYREFKDMLSFFNKTLLDKSDDELRRIVFEKINVFSDTMRSTKFFESLIENELIDEEILSLAQEIGVLGHNIIPKYRQFSAQKVKTDKDWLRLLIKGEELNMKVTNYELTHKIVDYPLPSNFCPKFYNWLMYYVDRIGS